MWSLIRTFERSLHSYSPFHKNIGTSVKIFINKKFPLMPMFNRNWFYRAHVFTKLLQEKLSILGKVLREDELPGQSQYRPVQILGRRCPELRTLLRKLINTVDNDRTASMSLRGIASGIDTRQRVRHDIILDRYIYSTDVVNCDIKDNCPTCHGDALSNFLRKCMNQNL